MVMEHVGMVTASLTPECVSLTEPQQPQNNRPHVSESATPTQSHSKQLRPRYGRVLDVHRRAVFENLKVIVVWQIKAGASTKAGLLEDKAPPVASD